MEERLSELIGDVRKSGEIERDLVQVDDILYELEQQKTDLELQTKQGTSIFTDPTL